MSKSPNLLIPAISGTVLIFGLAYGISSREYGAVTIETLESRVAQVETQAARSSASAQEGAAEVARLQSELENLLQTATTRSNLTAPAPVIEDTYRLGRVALAEELAAWDVDVLPDGRACRKGVVTC
jgi:hypothetical protein